MIRRIEFNPAASCTNSLLIIHVVQTRNAGFLTLFYLFYESHTKVKAEGVTIVSLMFIDVVVLVYVVKQSVYYIRVFLPLFSREVYGSVMCDNVTHTPALHKMSEKKPHI